MEKYKKEQLLEKLTSAAANFAYEAKVQDFNIKILITCEDGWANAKEI